MIDLGKVREKQKHVNPVCDCVARPFSLHFCEI